MNCFSTNTVHKEQCIRMDNKETAWLVMFVAVVVLDIALALLTGVVLCIHFVFRHKHKLQTCMCGQVPETGSYQADKSINKVEQVPGITIFRFEASIYFANAQHFRDKLYKKTRLCPSKLKKKKMRLMHETLMWRKHELEQAEVERKREREKKTRGDKKSSATEIVVVDKETDRLENEREKKFTLYRFAQAWQPPIKTLIIDVTVVNQIDCVGVKYLMQKKQTLRKCYTFFFPISLTALIKTLNRIVNDYKEVGIKVFVAGCKHVRDTLRLANFHSIVDYNILHKSVQEAIVTAQEINQKETKPSPKDVQLMKEVSEKTQGEKEVVKKEEEEEEYATSSVDAFDVMETGTGLHDPDDGNAYEAVQLLQKTEIMSDLSKGRETRFDSDVSEMIGLGLPSDRDSYMVTAF